MRKDVLSYEAAAKHLEIELGDLVALITSDELDVQPVRVRVEYDYPALLISDVSRIEDFLTEE